MRTRSFILVVVAVFAALVGGFLYVALSGGDEDRRVGAIASYSTAKFALEVNGTFAGYLKSFSGCGVSANVTDVAIGAKESEKSSAQYDKCQIRFSNTMTPAFYTWITDSLAGKTGAQAVSIVQTDVDSKSVAELELTGATLTRFGLPVLDASSAVPVSFEATLQPAAIKKLKGDGAAVGGSVGVTPKALLASNLRVTIPGLEQDSPRINKVEAWSFEVTPGGVELGNLTMRANDPGEQFDAWISSLTRGSPTERSVKIELLDATLKNTLFELNFASAGLIGADLLAPFQSGAEGIPRREYSMYVEDASIKF